MNNTKSLSLTTNLLILLGLVVGFLWAFSVVGSPQQTSALNGSDFNPGRIIDDEIFFDSNAMSVNQIQNFLNARVPTCDTNGERMHRSGQTRAQWARQSSDRQNPPYTCLKEYRENVPSISNSASNLCTGNISSGNKTAAQIIRDVGRACGINPQVLIVMLQKEQSLISDDWPWQIQYDRAMGYACPDSGPNNSANCNSDFYGFFNQVYNAAQAFKRYEANPTRYNYRANRNNFIYYHRTTNNGSCSGTNVFIENQATANLYIYTPYQPNRAALNNLYGTGDSCSEYGNRNFWRMFNDWFGPPIKTGSISIVRYSSTTDTSGKRASFGIQLNKKPTSNVTISLSIDRPSTARIISGEQITITPNNYNRPHRNQVVVEGLDEGNQVGPRQFILRTSRPASQDRNYSMLSASEVPNIPLLNLDLGNEPEVYRLYNSETRQHRFTANQGERDSLRDNGWSYDGVGFHYCPAGRDTVYRITNGENTRLITEGTGEFTQAVAEGYRLDVLAFANNNSNGDVPIYWLVNSNTGNNFYTANASEAEFAENNLNFTNKGVAFHTCSEDSNPVYRLYNSSTNNHLYTTSARERNNAVRHANFVYENVAFYTCKDQGDELYRLYNPRTKKHFYTTSASERDTVDKNTNFRYEGVAFKLCGDRTPVYRLYSRNAEKHFYTISRNERNHIERNTSFVYEGVAFEVK